MREIECGEVIPRSNVLAHILIEELEDERNTIREHQVLAHVLKLVDVVDLKVFQQQQQSGRYCLDNDLLMPVDVQGDLVGFGQAGWVFRGQHIHQNVQGISISGPGGGRCSEQDLEQGYHVLWEVRE